MNEPVIIGDCTLYLGDCREILPTLGKVDAVVTSPPYAQQRNYVSFVGDKYESLLGAIADTPGHSETQILVNLGLVHRDGFVIEYWEPFKRDMAKAGWRFFGWYVWDQQFGLPGDWNGRLAPSFEFVFHFNKQSRPLNKTHRSVSVGRKISKTALREKTGESSLATGAGDDVNPLKIPDSVIRVNRERSREGEWAQHPARFPVAFAQELIAPFTDTGDVVCDPFMGSGTTGVACVKLGRKFIGIEIEPKYFDIACNRIEAACRQGDLFRNQLKQQEKAAALPLFGRREFENG